MGATLKRFYRDEEGAALIEYSILIGLLVVAVLLTIISVGNWVSTTWTTVHSLLS